jgi:alginate O-acetyltransferase complex protein AlgJ
VNNHHFSGVFFIGFITASLLMSACYMRPALSEMETPAVRDVVQGKWPPQFEKNLNKTLPVYDPSRNLWGRAEYAMFGQGRKGVVAGTDGWLYTDEEFSCPAQEAGNLGDNIAYIRETAKKLAAADTRVAVIIVPEKARALPQHLGGAILPGCRRDLYERINAALKEADIPATDLLADMKAAEAQDALYLKTDTHWAPAGARLAAGSVRRMLDSQLPGLKLSHGSFVTTPGAVISYSGDLTRYVPGIGLSDRLQNYSTDNSVVVADAGNSLFDDSHVPEVTLVGTSYSANPNWNFAGFLKEALQTDILNAADEGEGPFTVMDKYLADDAWKNSPPRLVIWEIPERYLLMPHGVAG